MANEKDRAAPPPATPQAPVEGATKQFSLKMSGWLAALGADLDAPAGTPAALDELLEPEGGAAAGGGEPGAEDVSLERMLFPSEPPPKP